MMDMIFFYKQATFTFYYCKVCSLFKKKIQHAERIYFLYIFEIICNPQNMINNNYTSYLTWEGKRYL